MFVKQLESAPLWYRVLVRFARVFVSGGLATISAQLLMTPSISTLSELKVWGFALVVAFVSGGIAALDKTVRG